MAAKETWFGTLISRNAYGGDEISASALNVTKIVSLFAGGFAGLTQILNSTNVVQLSTTQMVTVWLVVAGLVVALAITDMICRAYVTGRGTKPASSHDLHIPVDVKTGNGRRHAELHDMFTLGSEEIGRVEWADDGKEGFVKTADIIR